jgi:hypothetical protein
MMGWVFSDKTTKWFRFKQWSKDTYLQLISLPSYLWPKPLKSAELSKEESDEASRMIQEEYGPNLVRWNCPWCGDWFHLPFKE